MPWARSPSLEGSIAASERALRDWSADRAFHFAILEKPGRVALGVAGLNRGAGGEAELHYWIRSSRAGRGLVTEACVSLIAWARDVLGLTRLTLWAGRENAGSRRVAEKLGFVHVGPLSSRPEGGNGHFDAESYLLDLRG